MLSIETCRALKEVGFPQPIKVEKEWQRWDCNGYGGVYEDGYLNPPSGPSAGTGTLSSVQSMPEELLYCPTIEDLLQEIGTEFLALELLTQQRIEWTAKGTKATMVTGRTPEDALAELYLSLRS
jgi:hypothetical protein